jgi:hypothetical protein
MLVASRSPGTDPNAHSNFAGVHSLPSRAT